MNNNNPIKLINENGIPAEYGEIPDLWHIAQGIRTGKGEFIDREKACEMILQVWHMAHDLKACIEGQGEARIVVEPTGENCPKCESDNVATIDHDTHGPGQLVEWRRCNDCQLEWQNNFQLTSVWYDESEVAA